MQRWLRLAGVVGFLATAVAAPGVQAASKTLYVGTCKGASPYATIQAAVNAVNDDGFTIYVCPGTYNESVQVQNKEDLTIRNYVVKNQPAPLIDAGGAPNDGFALEDSEEVEIRGLRITNADDGVSALNSPKTEVRNTIITNTSYGVYFATGSDKSTAQLNTINGNGNGNAGLLNYSPNVTLKQNTITSFEYGIYSYEGAKPTIESNTVTNVSTIAITIDTVTGATVKKNTTNFSEYGIYLYNATSSTISENTAKSNTNGGVYVESESAKNTLKKNLLQGNGTDAIDRSTGSKTAGTANTWSDNKCDTSTPGDLCGSAATQRRAAPTPPRLPAPIPNRQAHRRAQNRGAQHDHHRKHLRDLYRERE